MTETKSQFSPLPAETALKAKTIYNFSNLYLKIGDQIDQLITGLNLADLDPASEVPVDVVVLNSLVTIFQFVEGLPDHQAAEATRTRMDWKYALHLPLNYPGLQPASLCRFRQRLMVHQQGQKIFEELIHRIASIGLFSRHSRDLSAKLMIRHVCDATRLEKITIAFCQALESLAAQQPEWMRTIMLPHWYERYDALSQAAADIPGTSAERIALAKKIGSDASYLLESISDLKKQGKTLPAEINNLERVFNNHFYFDSQEEGCKNEIQWRMGTCDACNSFLSDSL